VLSVLGWAPILLQANRYHLAGSLGQTWRTSYAEIVASTISRPEGRNGWFITPLCLVVDDPVAQALGDAYGFNKELVPGLRVLAGAWSARTFAGEGRYLTAARGLGAMLLLPIARVLGSARLQVFLPKSHVRTVFAFRRVNRVAPAVGIISAPMTNWARAAWLLPFGAAIQGFSFILEAPSKA
jgi:hypothetical protein